MFFVQLEKLLLIYNIMFEFLASFGLLSCSQSDNQTNVKVNESVNDKTFNDLKDLESTSLHITR